MRRLPAIALLLATLAGCGFHLRAASPLPPVLARTFISVPTGSPLRYELESLLLAAGGEVVEELEGASVVLLVQSASMKSRTLSLDALGRAREYALTLNVKYVLQGVDGEALGEVESVSVERAYRFNPDNILARGGEQALVEREIYRVAAQQMVRRLRALMAVPETAAPAGEQAADGPVDPAAAEAEEGQ